MDGLNGQRVYFLFSTTTSIVLLYTPHHSVLCIIVGDVQFVFATTLEDLVAVMVNGGEEVNGKQEIKRTL